MAIKLTSTQINEYVKLISVNDSAIDWVLSYSFIEKEPEETDDDWISRKQKFHTDFRDYSQLVLKPDDHPTVFIFKNPMTLENQKLITNLQLSVAGIGTKKEPAALWFDLFDELVVGVASDMLSDPQPLPRNKHTKRLEKEVVEALAAQGVISELASILLTLSMKKPDKKN
ncbi:MAG: hypothetical protein QW255_05550 [Candidatus Bilamarchaeaceae archaeon]